MPRVFQALIAFVVAAALLGPAISTSSAKIIFTRRFTFDFKPETPLDDLLPLSPRSLGPPAGWIGDPTFVPEIAFGEPIPREAKDAMEETARIVAKINHVNKNKADAFLDALIARRPDLQGLPFSLGDASRMSPQQAKRSRIISTVVRDVLFEANLVITGVNVASSYDAQEAIWKSLTRRLDHDWLRKELKVEGTTAELDATIVAVLMQSVTPASEIYGRELPRFLSTISHVDATRALAKLVLYSPNVVVRKSATAALQDRRAENFTPLLLSAFQYPLPAAAQRSAEALVALNRKDLIGKLIDVLDTPDPRMPTERTENGKRSLVVRELVRVNHHRNCVLCHAPGNSPNTPDDVLTADIPLPNEPLPRSSDRYGFGRSPDITVRIDVNYLRQDFSLVAPVKNSAPWRVDQRFDYFARTRTISPEEAEECRTNLEKTIQPYHSAALYALRSLTGRDPGLTAKAWRTTIEASSPP